MKPKPLRQKQGKTFTFQPFSERITNLDIDIFHRVGHKNEEIDNERETFFHQAIVKWNGLNSSESYNQLCKELTHHVKILPQVIAQKEKLINTLVKYLQLKNEFSLEPTLEFVVALAKDLTHQEFYEYFPRIFPLIINLLYCKNYDQIEWAFQCLAYLFKILWKQLVQDIDNVLGLLLPLLNSNQPLYIINFSAQSFAYVARKIKNREHFIILILKALKKQPEGEEGCGTLFYETIKGVSGKLHSCTQSFLTDVVSCLGEQSLDTQCLTRVLGTTVDLLISELEPEQCAVVWTILHKKLSEFLSSWTKDNSEGAEQSILNILDLMKSMAVYKRGVTVTQPKPLIDLVIQMVQDKSLSDLVLQDVIIIAAALQRSPGVKISQEYACQLAYNVLRIPQRHLYLDFIERVFSCAGFNTLVLPSLLNYCESASSDSDLLQLLTKLVLHKVPSIALGSHFDEWKRIGLDFTNKKQNNLLAHMTSLLTSSQSATDDIICTILIAPHVNAPPHLLSKLHGALKRKLRSHDVSSDDQTQLYVYTLLVETMLRIDPGEVKFEAILEVLSSSLNEVCALRTIDLCLSVLEIDVSSVNQALTSELKRLCVDNLSSPYSQIRTLSSHILTLLNPLHSDQEVTIFDLIHQAETTETSLQSYRDKLNLIQKLETYPCTASLKYMFGVLYVNFSLLWKPVCGNIVSLGDTMEVKQFWPEYTRMLSELKTVGNRTETSIDSDLPFITDHYTHLTALNDKPDHCNVRVLLWETLAQMKKLIGQKNRDLAVLFLDYVNQEFRSSDAEIARVWNIRTENDEQASKNKRGGKKRKLADDTKKSPKKRKSSLTNGTGDESEDDSTSDVDLDTSKSSLNTSKASLNTGKASLNTSRASFGKGSQSYKAKRSRDVSNKNAMRLFLAHFNVMAAMANPKSVHREPEIRKIYEEFLCHRSSVVQKICLDCLLNYKMKDVEPYRDSLYALVDDKTFRNHLIMFTITSEDEQPEASGKDSVSTGRLKSEHRPMVMRLVLRIVYGKMLGGSGPKSGSKSSGSVRRAMILRFLAGCKPEEFDTFLDMAFKIVLPFISIESPLDMVHQVSDNIDLEQVIPPKRLLSLMNLADIVLSHCGSLAMDKLLRIILCLGSYVGGILSQRSQVHSGYLNILGKVRTSAILAVNEFFERYSEFPYEEDIVDAVFDTFVWTGLDKLNTEGVYSPTALTKLFIVWSKEPKYFPLLVKYPDQGPDSPSRGSDSPSRADLCPLSCLVQLLINDRTHISVKMVILDVIESLVTLEDEEEGARNVRVRNTVLSKPDEYKNLNYGSFLLKPYVLSILKYYQLKLNRSKKLDGLQDRDLIIVSRITELVSDEKTSTALAHVLIPLIIKKVRSGEQVISPLLTTLLNLMRNVTSSQANHFLRSLGVLFLTLVDSGARTLLLEVTAVLADKIKDEDIDMNLIRDLNAMNKKFVDQPDFDRRLDGFNRIQKLVTEVRALFPIQGVLIVYTAMHYLQYEKDISMRTSSSYCLQKLCPHLCRLYKDDARNKDYIVQNTILSLIRNNLQCKKTDFKEDSIMLLGYMVRECPPGLHPVLTDLHQFSCSSDLEMDMFETILHVQLHRRSRAMLRFTEQCKSLSKPLNARTITQYIIPMFSQFLLVEKYYDKNILVDSAIGALSTCVRLLRWREYETVLTTYLGKLRSCGLTYQKQLIKIVSGLLDAFHFDLHKAYEDENAKEVLPPAPSVEDEESEQANSTSQDDEDEEIEEENEENDNEDLDEDDEAENNNNIPVAKSILDKPMVLSKTKASRVIFSIHRDILPGKIKENNDEDLDDDTENNNNIPVAKSILDKPMVLSKSKASRVIFSIHRGILPDKIKENDNEDLDEDDDTENNNNIPVAKSILDKPMVLSKTKASRVIFSIHRDILPGLYKILVMKSQGDSVHKVNRKSLGPDRDEEDLMKIPVALAIVKLLQKLPDHLLKRNLPSLFTKLCTFCRSKLESVRKLTRETLQKIMVTLGARYLGTLTKEMTTLLSRGFQAHVLAFTLHSVLAALRESFTPGDLDHCTLELVEVFSEDLFGETAEEKDVAKIQSKVVEARSQKSYDAFGILAQYVSEKYLLNLVMPAKDVLSSSLSHKLVFKASECLRHIALGLADNKFVSITSLLTFAYGVVSQSIAALAPPPKEEKKSKLLVPEKPDSFIIPKEPRKRRSTEKKTAAVTNANIIVEFGLRVYQVLLKRERLRREEEDVRGHLDPVVPLMAKCLTSEHVK
ncbi:hypothetical protein M8J75_001199, partial [Diaphorina citri]